MTEEDIMQCFLAADRNAYSSPLLIRFLLLLLLYIPADLWALGHPYLVKDINPNGNAIDPYLVNPFASLDNSIIFAANDGITGAELWKSDGSAGGTALIKDINPGSMLSQPSSLTPLNGKVVFRATDPGNGAELWVTDGTSGGTQLLADIYPGSSSSNPQKFTVLGNTLYFVASTPLGSKLWKTGGTPAETMQATEFTPGYYTGIDSLTVVNGNLLVITSLSGATVTWTIWDVDPVAGTSAVITLLSQPKNITVCGGKTFFSLNAGGFGEELWLTDGTESGTVMVKDINAAGSSSPANLACLNSTLYFSATEPSTGTELWKSDGTTDGTVLVKDLYPGTGNSYLGGLKPFNDKLLFSIIRPDRGWELWTSDGSDSGTALVKKINPVVNYYSAGSFTVAGSLAFFGADDGAHYNETWVTDGTAENTYLLADLNPGGNSSSPNNFKVLGNTLFFSAYDGSSHYKLMAASLLPAPYSLITSPIQNVISTATTIGITGEAHSDTGSPVALVEVSTDNGTSWTPVIGTTGWSYDWQPTGDGVYSLLSRAKDLAGVVETPGPAVQVTVDRTPPSGFMKINNNAATTTTTLVTLEITASAQDPGLSCEFFTPPYVCGTVSIRFSNNGVSWSSWAAAQTTRSWTLLTGDGEKTVYAQLRDRAGNIASISKTIFLDTSLVPSSTITSPASGLATKGSSVLVTGTAATAPGGETITRVEVSSDGGSTWLTASGTTDWSINLPLTLEDSYNIKSRAWDGALIETPSAGITVTVDRTPPTGTLTLYYGVWTLNASDGGICIMVYPNICGALEMSFNGISWQPATTTPGTGGPLWLRDKAGNISYFSVGTDGNLTGGPIQVSRATPVYYSFIQNAYNAAQSGELIKLAASSTENLTLSRNVNLTIRGGFTSSFSTVSGTTSVTGSLTVQAGSNLIENIDLSGTVTVQGGDISASNMSIR